MNQIKLAQRVWQNPIYFIAFGFGSGLMPAIPGTWGTAAAIPLYYLMCDMPSSLYLLLTIAAFILGVYVSDRVSKDLGVNDYKGIVWDEVVGYLLTMFLAPQGLSWVLTGFILFRIFDIWRPQPIRWIDQKVHEGIGIMLDDVGAAIPAWLIMHALAWSLK